MPRRHLLKLTAASAGVLATPNVARAQADRTLRYVPGVGLTLLDPVWTPARGTHIHAYLVFDTLYGLDETLTPQPQMLEAHEVAADGMVWQLRLREGLRFHDGTPVLARDAAASIRRFAARDRFGQSLMAVTDELSALDDRTLRFRLKKAFPHLPSVLAGSTFMVPCIMPERLAKTDPFTQVTEMIGSGQPSMWRDRVGLFSPGSPLANEAGVEVTSGPRDYEKVKRDLATAGYQGEPVVVLTVGDNPYFVAISQVGIDQLRKAGLNIDVHTMDFITMLRRRSSKAPPEKGGWNIIFNLTDGLFSDNPGSSAQIRGDGKSELNGWAVSSKLEALRDSWLQTADTEAQKQIAQDIQLQLWQDVPYIPMGFWVRSTAHRRNIVDIPWGHAAFYGVRKV